MFTGRRFFSPKHSLKYKPPPKKLSFPLLKLPYLAQKYVIHKLDLFQVLEATMLSNTFHRTMQIVKIPVNDCHFLLGCYTNTVSMFGDNLRVCMEAFYSYSDDSTEWRNRKLSGEIIPIGKPWGHQMKVFSKSPESKLEVMDKITKHLLSISNVENFTIRCCRKYDFKNFFIWKYTKKIKRMSIHFYTTELTAGDDFLWMDFDYIIPGVSCEILDFEFLETPYTGINRMIRQWMEGKNDKLDDMKFKLPKTRNIEEDFASLEGIDYEKIVMPYEERCLRMYGTPLDHHFKINRLTDGLEATVRFDEQYVSLYVWHEKYLKDGEKQVRFH